MSIFSLFQKKAIYPVEVHLSHATIDNPAVTAKEGSSYQTMVTPETGYLVKNVNVFMGNVKHRGAYRNHIITIEKVTGKINIEIDARPEKEILPKIKFAPRLQK